MLKIWGRTNSVNVKKVLWCAEELGLDFERIDAGGQFGLVDEPAYRQMNPNGLVPCIQDGDLVVWESNAIVRYLCAKYGAGVLYAEDPAERAAADKWMDWTTSTFAVPFRAIFWNLVRIPTAQRDIQAIDDGLETCTKLLPRVDEALAERPFLSGSRFGMGDIPLGCFAYLWFELPIERPALPNLDAWYQRLTTRPAYRKQVMIPVT
ncbi:Glutathione S-transferase [Modicisalibacter ilicicola DSM 19980]|uniref:Glutathione S-transferase n=1 Tax=Modicisalibacter ilicicola DSM 19980 TaxID=1121942 RepID=A0A1M5E7T1_9GAMM|nr:glutathione S-transferase [Halomonas ilicicola]SHF75277.1 Glutathione S-transferase [Halomonas ilicicola DSM 19980]